MTLFKIFKAFFTPNKTTDPGLQQADPGSINQSLSIHQPNTITAQTGYPDKALYKELEQAYYQYFIGVNSLLKLDLNKFEQQVLSLLEKNFHENPQTIASQIPRLPDITPKLIHILRNDNFNWHEVAQLISRDPVLLVEIVKLANSSRFNLQASKDRLEHILVQLGLLEVRKVIMQTALKPIMLFEGGYFLKQSGSKIWEHSLHTAAVCQIIAQQQDQDPFKAYLSGLLHNLGMAIVVKKMNSIKEFKEAPRSILFKQQILRLCRHLSVLIVQSWGINEDVIQAIKDQVNGSYSADGSKPADGSYSAKGSKPAEGSIPAEGSNQLKTPLGQILYQASAVSMQYELEAAGRWSADRVSEAQSQKLYEQLKTELELANIS